MVERKDLRGHVVCRPHWGPVRSSRCFGWKITGRLTGWGIDLWSQTNYNYHHGKKAEGAEGEEKDKVDYPESDFYPFYMAKPTEEEIKEYEEKMKEYEEEMKKQEAEFKERQDKMKAEYEQHQEKMKAGFF